MISRLEQLKLGALKELDLITDAKEMELWRVNYLGKKSELTGILRSLSSLAVADRKSVGTVANRIRTELEDSLNKKKCNLREIQLAAATREENIDVTLPGRPLPTGRLHPITKTINEVSEIFNSMGFQVTSGPDVEWNYYNFEALNIHDDHPARDVMSTSWVDIKADKNRGPMLLRTHTTSVTARVIESQKPPIRVVEPGRVYRYEATDATHTPMFHQIDGLAVDKGITMADLKGTLYEFARRFFGEGRGVHFRCDYFPFVEPGVEMAIECLVCNGRGCRLCGNTGWLEILGAGMVHPRVLERGNIDPETYSGFAFGMGIDRLPMLRYGIDDIRQFYSNDLRFLSQF
ncbi:MAG: phenylalanine--tRNA ligase subunit alpha [Dehalococcoidales bacterium]|nr:phenylalanine--tRNA ligase subunit alpha [Dehalococcoidales bacterium]